MPSKEGPERAFWICAIVTTISAVVSASFSVAGLVGDGSRDTYALYAASRSIALPLVVLGCIWLRSRGGLAAMGFTMGLVQMFDAMFGIHLHDPSKTYGPLVLAVASFASVVFLLRTPHVGD
jgi:hypothetical protein